MRASDGVVFQGGGKARNCLSFGVAFDLDPQLAFVFRPGFAQDGNGAEGFGVHPGDQKGVAGLQLLPQLTDLNFA